MNAPAKTARGAAKPGGAGKNPGKKPSRRSLYNYRLGPKDDETILDCLALPMPLWAIAAKIGCCRSALADYIHRTEILQRAFTDAQESQTDQAEFKLQKHIDSGDLEAIKFYLSRRGRDRGWGDHQVVEQTGDGAAAIVIGRIDESEIPAPPAP